jgi:hypothetical protein
VPDRAAVLVLVPSPFTGAVAWGRLPEVLAAAGRRAVTVETATGDAGDAGDQGAADRPPYAARAIARAALQIRAEGGPEPIVLVGHSGAGPLLPQLGAAVQAARRQVAAYVFCDAMLPRAGGATRLQLLEAQGPGIAGELHTALHEGARFPAWTDADLHEDVPDPEARAALLGALHPRGHDFFTEPLPHPADWPDAPCGFLRTSPAYDWGARTARHRGWPVVERGGGHFAALTDPEGLARDLLALLNRL